LIIFDVSDGGMLWWYGAPHEDRMRKWLKSNQVVGIVKVAKYQNLELYNMPLSEGMYHIQMVCDAAPHRLSTCKLAPVFLLEAKELSKIEVGFGFWAFRFCDLAAQNGPDWEDSRSTDVFFAGTVVYPSAGVTCHRLMAVEKLNDLKNVRKSIFAGRVLDHHQYNLLLRSAKICVSPWGWGETTIRDYEAMLAGCVVIKPRTDFLYTWPPVDERHYVPCSPDFSDLQDQVDRILGDWDRYSAVRKENRRRIQAARSPESIADLVARIVHRCLDRVW
jgi:hypothetical protein